MPKKCALFLMAAMTTWSIAAQYKNDNVLYRLVYLQDLCKTLNENPGYLLLDVRSKGEYEDTSQFSGLNIGRFRNAVNISVQELGGRLKEIQQYKDQPIFVYCSHSQRSRRASKMLADSGFQKVFNINSGLSSAHLLPAPSIECLLAKTELKTPYSILSPQDLEERLNKSSKSIFLLDVRPDSVYRLLTTNDESNIFRLINGSTHIARADLEQNLDKIPPGKEIVVIDPLGDESAKAASWLAGKGYKQVSLLFNGIDAWMDMPAKELPGKMAYLDQRPPYRIIASADLDAFLKSHTDARLVDIRTQEQFSNKSKDSWRNIGQLKDAVNIPLAELTPNRSELAGYQNKPIVVYGFGGGDEGYRAARRLANAGYMNVNVLAGGLFHLRWAAHNVKGQERSADIVVNIPESNL